MTGVYTGLRACKGDYGFLAACDMPFLSVDVIRHIANLVQGFDVVVPRISGMLEPLHAAYSRKCLPYIEDLFQHEDLKILDLTNPQTGGYTSLLKENGHGRVNYFSSTLPK